MWGWQPKGPRFEYGQKIVGLQKKEERRQGRRKHIDASHHPEAQQNGYNLIYITEKIVKLYSMVEWMHAGLATKRFIVRIWSETSKTTKKGKTKAEKEKKKNLTTPIILRPSKLVIIPYKYQKK